MGDRRPRWTYLLVAGILALALLAGCAPAQPAAPAADQDRAPARAARPLIIASHEEPLQLAARPLVESASAFHMDIRLLNAGLVYQDERDVFHPELAEALPRLATPSSQTASSPVRAVNAWPCS